MADWIEGKNTIYRDCNCEKAFRELRWLINKMVACEIHEIKVLTDLSEGTEADLGLFIIV